MTHPRLSRLATDVLADEHIDPAPPGTPEEARSIELIAQAIGVHARARRRRGFVIAAGFAVAAGAVLVIGWTSRQRSAPLAQSPVPQAASVTAVAHALTDGVVLLRSGAQVGLDSGASLVPDDRVVTTGEGRASVVLSTGTHLMVEGGTDFRIVEQGKDQIFALRAGSVRADVAKLHADERFSIRTNDAEVEVRGTAFRVQVLSEPAACSAGIMTRVTVTEGVVAVRTAQGEALVHKDETWPPACAATARPPVAGPSASARLAAPASAASATVLPAAVSAVPSVPSNHPPSSAGGGGGGGEALEAASDLTQQNALFAEATAARRRGDMVAAAAAYERLASRHPTSPLAESALIERMRVLAVSDRRMGADAARAYLSRYPRGFARREAMEIAARSP